jgi:hypothetical protein
VPALGLSRRGSSKHRWPASDPSATGTERVHRWAPRLLGWAAPRDWTRARRNRIGSRRRGRRSAEWWRTLWAGYGDTRDATQRRSVSATRCRGTRVFRLPSAPGSAWQYRPGVRSRPQEDSGSGHAYSAIPIAPCIHSVQVGCTATGSPMLTVTVRKSAARINIAQVGSMWPQLDVTQPGIALSVDTCCGVLGGACPEPSSPRRNYGSTTAQWIARAARGGN